ncbi:MAG: serine/threonine-protein kinase [Planctomycetaceae bacterium]
MKDDADGSAGQQSASGPLSTAVPLGSPGSVLPIPVPVAFPAAGSPKEPADYSQPQHWPEIPGYVIQQHLGEGGFGSVYRAHSIRLNATVAIKVLRPSGTGWVELSRRLAQEVSAAARNRHPSVVQVLDSDTISEVGVPRFSYLVTEFLPGGNLREWLSSHHRSSADCPQLISGVQKLQQLCSGLQSLHTHGIVHRDIKPENIMLDQFGNPKLGDFGLCSIFSHEHQPVTVTGSGNVATSDIESSRLTRDGDLLGTPCYMAPEVLLNSQKASPASDQYAVGVILYELICGLRPRQRIRKDPAERLQIQEDVELLKQGRQPSAPLPPASRSNVRSQGLQRICLRCLRTDPATRYPNIAELASDLERWLNGERPAGGPVSEFWNTRILRPIRRHPFRHLAAITAALCCVLLILVAANALNQQAEAEDRNRQLNQVIDERNIKNQELNATLKQLQQQLQLFLGTLTSVAELTLDQDLASGPVFELRTRLLNRLGADCISALQSATTSLERQVLLNAGLSQLAQLLHRTGQLQQASEVSKELLEISEACITDFTTLSSAEVREHLTILLLLADIELDQQNIKAAEDVLLRLSSRLDAIHGEHDGLAVWRADHARRLAGLHFLTSKKMDSLQERNQAIIQARNVARQELLMRRNLRMQAPSGRSTVELCSTLASLSLYTYKSGHAAEAIEIQQEALAELQSVLADNEKSVADDARRHLIRLCFDGVMPLRSAGQVQQAIELGHKGLQHCKDQIALQPLVLKHQQELARGYGNQAETIVGIYLKQGDQTVLPEALQNLQLAAETHRAVHMHDPSRNKARDDAAIQLLRITVIAGLLGQQQIARQAFLDAVSLTRLEPARTFDQLEPGNSMNAAGALIGFQMTANLRQQTQNAAFTDEIAAALADAEHLKTLAAPLLAHNSPIQQLLDPQTAAETAP